LSDVELTGGHLAWDDAFTAANPFDFAFMEIEHLKA
jgi:hypothetical protein